mmetsp:Transcript_120788/g.352812  ORF Transcript_120788/g.352812 Transcript_120788/m.352812 type:complete len:292 (+) Transcript_120788:1965-2840(+)
MKSRSSHNEAPKCGRHPRWPRSLIRALGIAGKRACKSRRCNSTLRRRGPLQSTHRHRKPGLRACQHQTRSRQSRGCCMATSRGSRGALQGPDQAAARAPPGGADTSRHGKGCPHSRRRPPLGRSRDRPRASQCSSPRRLHSEPRSSPLVAPFPASPGPFLYPCCWKLCWEGLDHGHRRRMGRGRGPCNARIARGPGQSSACSRGPKRQYLGTSCSRPWGRRSLRCTSRSSAARRCLCTGGKTPKRRHGTGSTREDGLCNESSRNSRWHRCPSWHCSQQRYSPPLSHRPGGS